MNGPKNLENSNKNIDEKYKKEVDNKKDRLIKYGFGFVRLLSLISFMIYLDNDSKFNLSQNKFRCLTYILFAFFGASFNVKLLPKKVELIALLAVIFLAFYDLTFDFTVLLYATKTFIPDFFASKLDRKIWKFLLFASTIGLVFFYFILSYNFFDYLKIWLVLAFVQLISELGDQHFEHLVFFRHRYFFELASFLVWFLIMPLGDKPQEEKKLFYFDLIASLSYRLTGFLLKLKDYDFRFSTNIPSKDQ